MPNALDIFLELEKRGRDDTEIVTTLREQNFSEQEINDAINQSRIKQAVTSQEDMGGMEPSIMQTMPPQRQEMPVPVPISVKKKRVAKETFQQPEQQMTQSFDYQPAYSPQPAYPQQQYDSSQYQPYNYGQTQQASSQGTDIEAIEEIAEEIVNEKIADVKNKVEDMLEFKQSIQIRVSDIDDRLKRIELNIDRLQAALIGKVQDYSRGIKDLSGEMRAVEGAFGNILNPLIDNIKELNSITEKLKGKEKTREK